MNVNIKPWFRKAEEDELSARATLKEGHPSTVCFLSQQMAEKYLKALLIAHSTRFQKIHDLLQLESFLLPYEAEIKNIHSDLELLNRYYTETRYPDDSVEFGKQEATAAFEAALRVKEFVLEKEKISRLSTP